MSKRSNTSSARGSRCGLQQRVAQLRDRLSRRVADQQVAQDATRHRRKRVAAGVVAAHVVGEGDLLIVRHTTNIADLTEIPEICVISVDCDLRVEPARARHPTGSCLLSPARAPASAVAPLALSVRNATAAGQGVRTTAFDASGSGLRTSDADRGRGDCPGDRSGCPGGPSVVELLGEGGSGAGKSERAVLAARVPPKAAAGVATATGAPHDLAAEEQGAGPSRVGKPYRYRGILRGRCRRRTWTWYPRSARPALSPRSS